jgi:Protein of unknown function (DUF3667)
MMQNICKNCENQYKGKFCSACGQSSDTHEINLKYFLHDIQHGIFHFEKGFLYTIKRLIVAPGSTIRNFIQGKRALIIKPIAFVFLISTLYVLLAHNLKVETNLEQFFSGFSDGTQNAGGKSLSFIILVSSVLNFLQNHYAFSSLMLIPIYSLTTFLSFRKSGGDYMHHVVINCYLTGLITFVRIIPLPIYLIGSKSISDFIENALIIISFLLTYWFFHAYYNKNSFLKNLFNVVKSYILVLLFFVVLVFVAGLVQGILEKISN